MSPDAKARREELARLTHRQYGVGLRFRPCDCHSGEQRWRVPIARAIVRVDQCVGVLRRRLTMVASKWRRAGSEARRRAAAAVVEDLKERAAVDQEIHREKMRKTGAGLRGHFARLATMEPEDVFGVNEALHTASLMQPVSIASGAENLLQGLEAIAMRREDDDV